MCLSCCDKLQVLFQEKPCMLARDNENLSMVSPPYKLKMFTGSVCVLLTIVSLKLIKIKIKLIYATTSS